MGRTSNLKKQQDFKQFLSVRQGESSVKQGFDELGARMDRFQRWYLQTGSAGEVNPSQGLMTTPYDYLDYLGKTLIPETELWPILRTRHYLLSLMNHPVRLTALKQVEKRAFMPPPKIAMSVMEAAEQHGLALSVGDLGAIITGTQGERIGRRLILATGPFVKLGRFARTPFSGGAMPDVYGSSAALATIAACHALVCVPRNGIFADVTRQVALVTSAFQWMKGEEILIGRSDGNELIERWKHNLVGVLEPELEKGLMRAQALYEAGVRAFRVYSPEPGADAEKLVAKLRSEYGDSVEIFAGQVAPKPRFHLPHESLCHAE